MNSNAGSQKDRVRSQFGKNAWKYIKSEGHAKGTDLENIVEWLVPSREWICLDIATGGGHVAKALSRHAGTVVASDLTVGMLEAARIAIRDAGINNVLFIQADADSLPFLDSTFDAVTCRIAPHHFSDKEKFLEESSRVLKAGGKFLMVDNVTPEDRNMADFMNAFESSRDPSHVSCASPGWWTDAISSHGLKVERVELRKKAYMFRSWAERTAESREQIDRTEKLILSAPGSLMEYYEVQVEGSHVVSLKVDEMMVMASRAR